MSVSCEPRHRFPGAQTGSSPDRRLPSARRRRSITTTSNHAAEYDTATLTAASTSNRTMTTDHSARAGANLSPPAEN
jgi:hypothetical protein